MIGLKRLKVKGKRKRLESWEAGRLEGWGAGKLAGYEAAKRRRIELPNRTN
jgi:hypothetical protein